jgi:hypothetical protein
VADISLSGVRVAWELDRLMIERGNTPSRLVRDKPCLARAQSTA